MTTTTAPPTPNLNHAAQQLIEALDGVDAMAGFRLGFVRQIEITRALAGSDSPIRAEALQLLPVYEALDALAEAVAARKGNHDG